MLEASTSAMSMEKTVTIFRNGTSISGQIFDIDPSRVPIHRLAVKVRERLGPHIPVDLKFFNVDGILINQDRHKTSLDTVYYYAFRDEEFIKSQSPMKKNGGGIVNYFQETSYVWEEDNLVVKLNVGGVVFETMHKTLINDPNTKLAEMFKSPGGPPLPRCANNGAYFLDRDPKYFAPILNFLRTRKLSLDTGLSVQGVIQEAIYFEVQECIPPNWAHCTVQEALAHFAKIKITKK